MSLPIGWIKTTIDEVTSTRVDNRGPEGDSDFSYVDIGSIDNSRKCVAWPKTLAVSDAPSRARQRLRLHDTLVSMTRPNLNAVAMVTPEIEDAIGSTGFHVLRPLAIEPKWLFYIVQTADFIEAMSAVVQGALYPAVRPKDIRRYEIPIAPLPEQRRIVAEIEKQLTRIDAAVAALGRAKLNLKRQKASVLMAASEGRLLAPTEAWQTVTVGDVGEVKLGRQRAPKHQVGEHIRPYLRVANVFEDRIDTSDVLQMNFTPSEFETFSLRSGDVLLNEGQSLELVGRAAMYRDEVPGACFQNTLIRFRAGDRILPRFALLVFRAWLHSGRFRSVARWTTNIAHLGASRLAEMTMSLPPLEQQSRIVEDIDARLSRAAAIEQSLQSNLIRGERLRQSILRRAFEGKLVAQDAGDEPAFVTLARITQERKDLEQVPDNRRRGQAMAKSQSSIRRGLVETLRGATEPLTPEKLFANAGHSHESVDDFYAELKLEIDRGAIREVRLSTSKVTLQVVEQ